ncbi:MAG TPA: LysR family transcriptional regulator [Xanthobacteraceae bacterium]|nr:LysR family transcriptional regulator [Xanthobacteraceae bacterium]
MFQKLEFMIALAREKHFGRAAASCGVAQPTFSQAIQQLEEAFNVPLVIRSSRFQGFTPEGDLMLVWARRLVGDVRAMREQIIDLKRGINSHIRIAAVPSAMPIVASLTTPFQLRNPTLRFTILTRPSDELIALLHQREIDAGVTYVDNEPIDDVLKVPLYREQYLLLTTKDGPLGNLDRVAWSDLAGVPLCLMTRDLQNRRIIDAALRAAGVDVSPMVETDSIMTLSSHVRTGNCVSIVPRSTVSMIDMSGAMRALPLGAPEVTRTIGLVVSQRFPIPPITAWLIDDARSYSAPELLAPA